MRNCTLFVFTALALSSLTALIACSSSDSSSAAEPAAAKTAIDAGASDAAQADAATNANNERDATPTPVACASPTPFCQAYGTYATACGYQDEVCNGNCVWIAPCDGFDDKINSEVRKAAEIACLTTANCDTTKRYDCDYRFYQQRVPTDIERSLVTQYCATCDAGNPSCTTSAIAYDADAGALAVSNIFTAAWELSDAVTSQIATKCTGAALDQSGGGTCDDAFGTCMSAVLAAQPELAADENLSCD